MSNHKSDLSSEQFGEAGSTIFHDFSHMARNLTKRELFAAMAMQGRLSAMVTDNGNDIIASGLAKNAVIWADALIKALEEKK